MKTTTAFETITIPIPDRPDACGYIAEPLVEEQRQETLDFLTRRPLQTVVMSGLILDNGMASPLNRGTFYGCRDLAGRLVGVALVGRNTLLEVRDDEAIEAFAECIRLNPDTRMVFAEDTIFSKFWGHYAKAGETPRSSSTQLLIATREITEACDVAVDIRIARDEDLDQIVSAHAEMVLAETGMDPLATDPEGFTMRCSARIEKGRIWVWVKDGKLIFKTDILCVTPEAIYIEGLWIHPAERRKGYSRPCLAGLCKGLLNGSNTICGFVDEDNIASRSALVAAGFLAKDKFAKIYL